MIKRLVLLALSNHRRLGKWLRVAAAFGRTCSRIRASKRIFQRATSLTWRSLWTARVSEKDSGQRRSRVLLAPMLPFAGRSADFTLSILRQQQDWRSPLAMSDSTFDRRMRLPSIKLNNLNHGERS